MNVSLCHGVPESLFLLIAVCKAFVPSEVEDSRSYHKKSPDSVVGEDGAGDNKHCEAYETVELVGVRC